MNAFAIPLLLFAVGDEPVKPKLPLGKDTTVVNGPLDKNGYIDYEAALNERLSKGIKPEQNANVLLWQAFGPRPGGTKMPPDYFKWLGAPEPPEKGDYFVTLEAFKPDGLTDEERLKLPDTLFASTMAPWVARDRPALAAWLKANEKSLAVVAEAVKRPAYFNPLVSIREENAKGALAQCSFGNVIACRQVVAALAVRATLRLGEGDSKAAWADLLACHRFARAIANGGSLVELLFGYASHMIASHATATFVANANLSADALLAVLKELKALPPLPRAADKIDVCERFMLLDAIQLLHAGRGLDGTKTPVAAERKALDALDWGAALRDANASYTRLIAEMRLKSHTERVAALDKHERETLDAVPRTKETDLAKLAKSVGPEKAVTVLISNHVIGVSDASKPLAIFGVICGAVDRADQHERNLHVAVALAAYRKANGRYPAKLADLAPKYLAAVPDDLFAEKSLVYKPDANGYLLHSVGLNGKDDGGTGDDLAVRVPLSKP